MHKFEITVSGDVQGVGYRFFAVREAQKLGLTGWVRNLPNGDVEILAEGEKNAIDYFLGVLKIKHSYAVVNDIKVTSTEISKKEFSDFDIAF